MLKAKLAFAWLLAVAFAIVPAHAQMGGGGGGGGGGFGGIPLGSGGSHDDSDSDKNGKDDKKSASERPVSGVVTDADNNPIVGAVVQLKNTKTQKVIVAITRGNGAFQFSALSKNVDYEVTAVFKDHSSAPHMLSAFDPRVKPVVNLQIK